MANTPFSNVSAAMMTISSIGLVPEGLWMNPQSLRSPLRSGLPTRHGAPPGATHEKPAVRRQEHSCPLVVLFGMAMGA
jgi:hypothetical protein